ncbi:hypothetical protein NLG97_g5635 [Lecanicillium saksenae]|uniref:Uncharacterized protein n=1 Tax=Lecanicillium saksenae TaxID=468837 RepID=A0ACC1QV30_9HYPO|nr:hypothetical protein NLG97_g5635 [Lecanicillium saksenae]
MRIGTIASNITEAAPPVRRVSNRRERRKQYKRPPLASNATASEISEAGEVVEKALRESAKRNALRLANPLRNNYNLHPGTKVRQSDDITPSLVAITDEIARVAALISEVEVRESTGNYSNIATAPAFIGLGVLSTDKYTGAGAGADGLDDESYINTANFYRQIRNLRIDITATRPSQNVIYIHYQVTQATSIQNVELIAKSDAILVYKIPKKRSRSPGGAGGSAGHIGSVSVIDSSFEDVDTAIIIEPPSSKPGVGSTGVVVENVAFHGVGKAVADTSGATLLAASPQVDLWALGPTYKKGRTREFSMGQNISGFSHNKSLIGKSGSFFERAKPQYQDRSLADFVHIKDFGAKGDGVIDDTAAF